MVRRNPYVFFIFFSFGRTVGIHGNHNSLTINFNCLFSVIGKSVVISIMSLRPFFWRHPGEAGAQTSKKWCQYCVKMCYIKNTYSHTFPYSLTQSSHKSCGPGASCNPDHGRGLSVDSRRLPPHSLHSTVKICANIQLPLLRAETYL